MLALDLDVRRLRSLHAIRACLLELKWLRATTRLELALRRHHRALRYADKAGFNPDQPRDDHGRWTDGAETRPSDSRVRLAGDIPTGDSPEIPKEPPPTTKLRNVVVRSLARRLGPYIWAAVEAGSWVYDHKSEINSFFDAAKSLEELQGAANSPADGYDIHHIVEQSSAESDGYPKAQINAPDNLVRIPRWRHWLINGWYQTPNEDFGWLTPRQYLKGKSWDERRDTGIYALKKFGVLRP
jgi:hypothetical protein